jgi:hypothetical protein
MSVECSRCGSSGCRIEWHHPTGRVRGWPIHWLAVPLCVPCHVGEHRIWSRAGLEASEPDQVIVLRRLALFCHLQSLDDLAREIVEYAELLAGVA